MGAITVIVMLASVLMTLPSGTPGRSLVAGVASPYYSQNWRLFAPHIMKNNVKLEVRAQWRDDDGALVKTDWMPVTEIEQRAVAGNPMPSRTQKLTWNATQAFQKRYRALESEQQDRARDTFIERSPDGGYRAISDEALIAELGENDRAVVRYLRMDYMLTRYATVFATAALDRTVERVQWRIVTTRANDFTHRFSDEQQFDTKTTVFGWRQATAKVDSERVAAFTHMIERNGAKDELRRGASPAQ